LFVDAENRIYLILCYVINYNDVISAADSHESVKDVRFTCKQIFTKFCTSGDMLDVIIGANFGVEKLRGLENVRGQIFEFPTEMAGHPYNSAAPPRSL